MQTQALSQSLEDYLEAIYQIIREREGVRSKDIAVRLNVRTPSVTGALQGLSSRGLINYEPYGVITLTPEGRRRGEDLAQTHEDLRSFLVRVLNVAPSEADETACKMEHVVPPRILDRFVQFVQFMDTCPHVGVVWIEGFGFHCKDERNLDLCERCVNTELERTRRHRTRSKPRAGSTRCPGAGRNQE